MARQMKDSGIEWIGEIPEGWSCGQLGKYVTVFNGDRSSNYPTPEELRSEGIPFFTSFDLNEDEILMHPEGKYLDRDKYERLGGYKSQIGDIVFCLRGSVGKCSINMRYSEGTVASSLMGIRCHSMDNKFVFYTLVSDVVGIQNDLLMNGTCAANLSAKNVCKYKVVVPSLFEQQRIAAFLDRQCAEIDAVIERTKATIEEYKKLKQAVITKAVTKGVRGPRPMKDSGIEWIGEIPGEWRVVRGKNLFVETNERSATGEEELLTVSHITGITPRSQKNVNMFMSESLVDYKICRVNDIAANTMWMWQGAIGVSKYHGVISPSYNVYRQTSDEFDPDYLDYLLRIRPLVDAYNAYSTGITASRLRLYPEQFLSFFFFVPSREEQREIVEHLDRMCHEMDTLIAKKTALLTELETYKKSLIYEYVTGKKEVQ